MIREAHRQDPNLASVFLPRHLPTWPRKWKARRMQWPEPEHAEKRWLFLRAESSRERGVQPQSACFLRKRPRSSTGIPKSFDLRERVLRKEAHSEENEQSARTSLWVRFPVGAQVPLTPRVSWRSKKKKNGAQYSENSNPDWIEVICPWTNFL